MDNAVALVRTYLHVNGYFTVCEYPVLEAARRSYRTVTDLDVLAVRFPGAGRFVGGSIDARRDVDSRFEPDAVLGVAGSAPDMLIGEIKEGRPRLNEAATDVLTLQAAMVRFGCCSADEAASLADDVVRQGSTRSPHGHRIRLVIFASTGDATMRDGIRVVPLGHVVHFLEEYLEENWDVLRHAQFKDPAFGFLMTLAKARRAGGPSGHAGRTP
ncbi:MAG: hypothetical protein WD423_06990 [Rhodothermales bacterium]